MNNQKPGFSNRDPKAARPSSRDNMQNKNLQKQESKLDQWIEQKMQTGSPPPGQHIVHARNNAGNNQNAQQQKNRQQQGPKKSFFKRKPKPQKVFFPKFSNRKYKGKLRIFPLGGLNEVGRNCMVLEYEKDIIIIDIGLQFPDEDFLGVDYIIPDITYLKDKVDRIKGVLFTHGHLDHIGAVPYIIPELNFPEMYGTQLTMGLIQKRVKEFGLANQARINVIQPTDKLKLGNFEIDFFSITHSIPDAVGLIIKTPAGSMVHTGDFKFDMTPAVVQRPVDFAKISALSQQDIGALFIDSTNATKPGHTITETKIGESLDAIVKNTTGRIVIASFASQIGRLQQVINIAHKYGRSIVVSGRSLVENIELASKLGYLRVPQGLIHEIHKVKKMPDEKTMILTTGSQGEDVAALSRMALEQHPIIKIKKGDTVILSSSPIPGNEKAITAVINNLCRLGAKVIDNKIMDVHTSGHAQQEDLKLMMTLVSAKNVVPVHGEYYMRVANKDLAMSLGYTDEQTPIIENGGVLVMENNEIRKIDEKIQCNYILVDGLGVGDIGAQVIMDRQTMAENGIIMIMIPINKKSRKIEGEIEILSRGFIYMKESDALVAEMNELARNSYNALLKKRPDSKRNEAKKYLRDAMDRFVHQKIERHPLVLPILIEK